MSLCGLVTGDLLTCLMSFCVAGQWALVTLLVLLCGLVSGQVTVLMLLCGLVTGDLY